MPNSATNFPASDAPGVAATDVTTTFELGGKTYHASMPKQTPFLDAYKLWGRQDKAREAQERLARPDAAALTVEQRGTLEAALADNPDIEQIIETFITGKTNPVTGYPSGGFFRWCISPEDYDELIRLAHDRTCPDVDWVPLFGVALDLLLEFEEPMARLAEEAGLVFERVTSAHAQNRKAAAKAKAPAKSKAVARK